MGDKKEVAGEKPRPSEAKHFLMKPMKGMEEEVKGYLLPGEHVIYQAAEMFFTDRRIIKHRHDWFARTFHFFYSTYEDMDYRFLESIKAKNVINAALLFWGLFAMLLGPISIVLGSIPGLGWLGEVIMSTFVDGLGISGLLIIGSVLVIAGVILRDRVIEFHGLNTVIRTTHFHDEELLKVRELQHLRWRRVGMD
ncbi:hypothetical protein JXA12_04270 [Candidatus Woesearchaeota archaeon]|nr:hypothetical protein [Candidatus Woesearchaeota archaeon]